VGSETNNKEREERGNLAPYLPHIAHCHGSCGRLETPLSMLIRNENDDVVTVLCELIELQILKRCLHYNICTAYMYVVHVRCFKHAKNNVNVNSLTN